MSSSDESYSEDEDYIPEESLESDNDQEDDAQEENVESTEDNCEKEEEKSKIEELWNNFKQDVSKKENKNLVSNGEQKNGKTTEIDSVADTTSEKPSVQKESDTVTITKVYDFAGEEVKVTKEVKRDSAEAIDHFRGQTKPVPSKGILGRSAIGGSLKKKASGGIGNVLGRLGKKPKLSTLEKSKLDWKQYKEDEGIEDELQSYNKGKQGYLEKVSFLERTEMRQFERERDMRLKQSSKR